MSCVDKVDDGGDGDGDGDDGMVKGSLLSAYFQV